MLWVKAKAHDIYHKKTKHRKLYLGILLTVFPFQICSLGYFLACTEPLLTNGFKQKWDNYAQQNHRINVGQKTSANFHPKFKTSSGENVIFISGFCCTPACPFFAPNGGYNVGFFPAWDPSVQEAFLRFFSKVKPK